MSRRIQALKPQLNQIRIWARQGLTDAWIAHALDTTPATISAFRAEHSIERGADEQALPPISAEMVAADELPDGPLEPRPAPRLVPVPDPEPVGDDGEAPARKRRRRRKPGEGDAADATDAAAPAPVAAAAPVPVAEPAEGADPAAEPRPRRRRGGRGRKRAAEPLTARLQQGVVLVLDAAVLEDETFKTRWLEAGSLVAEIGEDAITLRRADDA